MDLFALARNPVPSGAVDGIVRCADGVEVRYARFEATRGPRRGTVCVFPGRKEFIEKYFEVIADLRRRGFAVATMDWRGQGGSQRMLPDAYKGHVWDFADYDLDLATFMREIVLPDCPPPYIALAHSLGGNILLRNAASPGTWFERMVLTAPMIALHPSQLHMPAWLARTIAEDGLPLPARRALCAGRVGLAREQGELRGQRADLGPRALQPQCRADGGGDALALSGPTFAWLRAAMRSMAVVGILAFRSGSRSRSCSSSPARIRSSHRPRSRISRRA